MGCRLPVICLLLLSLLQVRYTFSQGLPLATFNIHQLIDEEHLMLGADSSFFEAHYQGLDVIENNDFIIKVLPLRYHLLHQQAHPLPHLNSSLQRASGNLHQLSAGIYAKWKFIEAQFLPEYNHSVNADYVGFTDQNSTLLWSSQYNWLNHIDHPDQALQKLSTGVLGQTYVSVHNKFLQLKVSAENKHWGPGKYDALLLSSNSPGFLHFGFSNYQPITTAVGVFDFEWMVGQLKNSKLIPSDTSIIDRRSNLYLPKRDEERMLGAMNLTYQPKWIPGLTIGVSNAVQQYVHNAELNDLLGGISSLVTKFEGTADIVPKQQLQSFHIALKLFESHSKVYFEWLNQKPGLRLIDTKRSSLNKKAWLAGFSKFWPQNSLGGWLLDMEFTQLEQPIENTLLEGPGIYTDPFIRHGFTHKGENLGSVLFSGSNRQTISLAYRTQDSKYALLFQRINNNNDFYFYHFSRSGDFRRNWIDLIAGIQWYATLGKRVSINTRLNYNYTLNYRWEHDLNPEDEYFAPGNDIEQWHGSFSLIYSF